MRVLCFGVERDYCDAAADLHVDSVDRLLSACRTEQDSGRKAPAAIVGYALLARLVLLFGL